jgi:hypothetical protein
MVPKQVVGWEIVKELHWVPKIKGSANLVPGAQVRVANRKRICAGMFSQNQELKSVKRSQSQSVPS